MAYLFSKITGAFLFRIFAGFLHVPTYTDLLTHRTVAHRAAQTVELIGRGALRAGLTSWWRHN